LVPFVQVDTIDDAALEAALRQACSDAAGLDFQSVVTVASAMRAIAGANREAIGALIAGLHTDQALIDHETQRASMFSLFAVDILQRIQDRYGTIADASDLFESDLIDAPTAAKIGRAIELYEGGDWDSAAALIAPRLERIVRRLAALAGLPVTRSPDPRGRSGGVKGLVFPPGRSVEGVR
jgi:hypothetical protein